MGCPFNTAPALPVMDLDLGRDKGGIRAWFN
jgi:hypothetical protein